MKIILFFMLLIPIAMAQPRPTGNVLTDGERTLLFKELAVKEAGLLKNLNTHVKKCYPSLVAQKSLMDLVSSYRLLTASKESGTQCTPEQLACLQNVPLEIRGEGLSLLKGVHYKEFLIKQHKLKEQEAESMIIDLKLMLKIPLNSNQEPQLFNKS